MKKLLALLLSIAMVLSLAACADEPEVTTAPTEITTTAATEETTVPVTTAPVVLQDNKLIYGTLARFDGDFAAGLFTGSTRDITGGNAAESFDEQTADAVVAGLLTDYGTLALQRDGTYAYNMTVLAQEPVAQYNADGTLTYTLEINKDLTYNTGKAITARDYVFAMLFANSATCVSLGGRGNDGSNYPNGQDFYNCRTAVFADIRLLGDYSWSVTVTANAADYVFASSAVSAAPWDVEFWFGQGYTVADDGEGAYLCKDGEPVMMDLSLAAAVNANFMAARSGKVLPLVTAGPYQLESYDEAAKVAVLKINPNYAGNFEGQKPSIAELEIRSVGKNNWEEALEDGAIHLLDTVKNGGDINTVKELIDEGAKLDMDMFDRAGYGKLQFACDVTPTQYVEVRQALAHLIDREAVVDLYCQGWGTAAEGPFNDALWMARESENLFGQTLENYEYSVKEAEKLLEEGGWVLDEYGNPWEGDGLRYKEVSWDDAEYMDECSYYGDTALMPLVIKWAASENNLVTDLLKVLLVESDDVANLGMEIRVDEMDFVSMLSHMYRQDIYGMGGETDFGEPYYSMFNLAAGWESALQDYSFRWSGEDAYVKAGYNSNYLFDLEQGGLDQLSMAMVYGVAEGDRSGYLEAWQDYILRYNELLPDLPLYSDRYATVYVSWLRDYDQDTFWGFQNAILYATVAE